jgi:LysM repeat protein
MADEDEPSIVRTIEDEEQPSAGETQVGLATPKVQTIRPVLQYHTVRAGDTLSRIAARYNLNVNQVRQMNSLRDDNIRPNQKLLVKGGRTAPLQKISSSRPLQNAGMIVHQIRSGDTLWKISKRYGVKVTDIKKWNSLRGDTLKPNQKIRIYAATHAKRMALVKS